MRPILLMMTVLAILSAGCATTSPSSVAPAAAAPGGAAPTASPHAAAGNTTAAPQHVHASGQWTASADTYSFVGSGGPAFSVPATVRAGTIVVNWTASEAPAGVTLSLLAQNADGSVKVAWSRPMTSSPATFTLTKDDAAAMKDATHVDVGAKGGAAVQIAFAVDGDFWT